VVLSETQLQRLQQSLRQVAQREMMSRFTQVAHYYKQDGSLLTEADLAVQAQIGAELARLTPGIPLLGEEMELAQQRAVMASEAYWCLDPLDGTSNFAAAIPYFAVSLALIVAGEIELGLVYDPNRDELFMAKRGGGATCNGQVIALRRDPRPIDKCCAIVDFKRLPAALARKLASEPSYASQRSFGAVALDWCWLAMGRGHLYLHGKQNLWDYAAGYLIFSELGGQACTLEGEALFRHALQPRSAVAALDPGLFKTWLAWLGIKD